jgi:3-oxoacyl-[acyl-carrier-protein] synthase-1
MCTSVGRATEVVCAAVRAGMVRPRRIRDLLGLDPETDEPVPLLAHPARAVTEGFYKVGRWLRLASAAVGELRRRSEGPPPGAACALYLVTRSLGDAFLDCCDVDEIGPADAAVYLEKALLEPLCSTFALPVPAGSRRIFARGPVGVAAALAEAAQQLGAGRLDRALVVAVDSWIDPTLLDEAAAAARLKTPDSPTGLSPGEAAVAFWVERADPRARGLAVVEKVALQGRADDPLAAPEPSAVSVAAAVQDALGTEQAGDVIVDLTGEDWRARQWGTALASLGGALGATRFHYPALSLGDVGAASGAVGLLLALQALERRWSAGDRCLVVSCSDSGEAASIAVRRS